MIINKKFAIKFSAFDLHATNEHSFKFWIWVLRIVLYVTRFVIEHFLEQDHHIFAADFFLKFCFCIKHLILH